LPEDRSPRLRPPVGRRIQPRDLRPPEQDCGAAEKHHDRVDHDRTAGSEPGGQAGVMSAPTGSRPTNAAAQTAIAHLVGGHRLHHDGRQSPEHDAAQPTDDSEAERHLLRRDRGSDPTVGGAGERRVPRP
jgi:hypothetical protein